MVAFINPEERPKTTKKTDTLPFLSDYLGINFIQSYGEDSGLENFITIGILFASSARGFEFES